MSHMNLDESLPYMIDLDCASFYPSPALSLSIPLFSHPSPTSSSASIVTASNGTPIHQDQSPMYEFLLTLSQSIPATSTTPSSSECPGTPSMSSELSLNFSHPSPIIKQDPDAQSDMQDSASDDDTDDGEYMYQPHRPKKSAPTSTTSSHRRRNSPTNSPHSRKTASETPAPTGPPKPKRQGSLLQTCVNCGTNKTPVWRRNPRNETICNACSLYMKNHNGRSRPSQFPFRKFDVMRRNRGIDA
ncbi:putative electron transfer flavoprotein subunit [Rhizoclosmatium sp. JEL0117]|nr:putative electron transfer flavoprotein subunit [Rhizoclosmatium sp. JEL0117]